MKLAFILLLASVVSCKLSESSSEFDSMGASLKVLCDANTQNAANGGSSSTAAPASTATQATPAANLNFTNGAAMHYDNQQWYFSKDHGGFLKASDYTSMVGTVPTTTVSSGNNFLTDASGKKLVWSDTHKGFIEQSNSNASTSNVNSQSSFQGCPGGGCPGGVCPGNTGSVGNVGCPGGVCPGGGCPGGCPPAQNGSSQSQTPQIQVSNSNGFSNQTSTQAKRFCLFPRLHPVGTCVNG